jgi:hypothetical protein
VEVRIRRASEGESKFLTSHPFREVSSVIPIIKDMGVADSDDDLKGQFVVGEYHVYYEVVIQDMD